MWALAPWGSGGGGVQGVEESSGNHGGFGHAVRPAPQGRPAGAARCASAPGGRRRRRGVPAASTSSARVRASPSTPNFDAAYAPQYARARRPRGVADEDHRRVRHGLEQRQAGGRDEEGRAQVDVDGCAASPPAPGARAARARKRRRRRARCRGGGRTPARCGRSDPRRSSGPAPERSIGQMAGEGPPASTIRSWTASSLRTVRPSRMTSAP